MGVDDDGNIKGLPDVKQACLDIEKSTNIDNIEEIIELICLLIKASGRMIISMLKQKKS